MFVIAAEICIDFHYKDQENDPHIRLCRIFVSLLSEVYCIGTTIGQGDPDQQLQLFAMKLLNEISD